MVKIIVVILSLLNYFKQSHQCTRKKCPRSSHALLKKKNLNFLANLPFLFSSLFLHLPAVCRNRDAMPNAAYAGSVEKKIVAEIQLFYIFLKNKQHFGIIKNLSFWWQPVFLSEMLMTWADCWGSPSLA